MLRFRTPFLRKLFIIICALSALVLLWSIFYPWGTWRYKMTVVVETPEGTKTGSVVREIGVGSEPALLGTSGGGSASAKGEAVIVDLGQRGKLFVLNDYPYGESSKYRIFWDAFPMPEGRGALTPQGIRYYRSLKNKKAVLSANYNLFMVTFGDLEKPESVKLVRAQYVKKDNQTYKIDRFQEIFGAGVSIKEIIIETTEEPVTWKIERTLPWIFNAWPQRLGKLDTLHVTTTDKEKTFELSRAKFTMGK